MASFEAGHRLPYQRRLFAKMILKITRDRMAVEITQIRRPAAEVDLIPRVHGSAMYYPWTDPDLQRLHLAPLSEQQKLDGLDENEVSKALYASL